MSAAVLEQPAQQSAGSGDNVETSVEHVEENTSSLEEVTDKMDNVKIGDTSTDPEKIIKHPLQNAWTLWFFKNDKSRSWEDNQRPIITVTTVEDFWSLYNHIEVASRLPPGSDYSLFKEGIFPDWEDPRNAPGGRWMVNVDRKQRAEYLDTYWLEILFFLIGEHADQHAHQVCDTVQTLCCCCGNVCFASSDIFTTYIITIINNNINIYQLSRTCNNSRSMVQWSM